MTLVRIADMYRISLLIQPCAGYVMKSSGVRVRIARCAAGMYTLYTTCRTTRVGVIQKMCGNYDGAELDPALDFNLGPFRTYHRTRSSVAMESSTELCPTVAPPSWIDFPRISLAL